MRGKYQPGLFPGSIRGTLTLERCWRYELTGGGGNRMDAIADAAVQILYFYIYWFLLLILQQNFHINAATKAK